MESLGDWRRSGVLLHLPFGDRGHPGNIGPSAGILPKVCIAVFLSILPARPVPAAAFYIGYSSIPIDSIWQRECEYCVRKPLQSPNHRTLAGQSKSTSPHELPHKIGPQTDAGKMPAAKLDFGVHVVVAGGPHLLVEIH